MPPALTLAGWLRADIVARALEGEAVNDVLELGCGRGAMAAWLAARADYVGVEPDPSSAEVARARLAAVGRGAVVPSLEAVEPGRAFDMVCAFEVLEHVADDDAALAEWAGRVRPGGLLVLSVPAFQARFGPWDELVGHYRRYEPDGLRSLLAGAGLVDVQVHVYGFPLGTVSEHVRDAVARRRARRPVGGMAERTAASGRTLQPPDALAVVNRAASAPFRWAQRRWPSERGVGLVAVARHG